MKPPKTAALWALLERLGWRHDSLPISTAMASHEAMENELAGVNEDLEFRRGLYALQTQRMGRLEKELAEIKAGFDDEGRTAAEACCEEFKRDLMNKLAAERALADRLAQEYLILPGPIHQWIQNPTGAIAAWKAARNEQKP